MDTSPAALLVRQPIVDLRADLIGYRLSCQAGAQGEPSCKAAVLTGLSGLSDLLADFDPVQMLAGNKAFVALDAEALRDASTLVLLNPARTVLCLSANVEQAPDALDCARRLASIGFGIQIDAHPARQIADWRSVATHVRIDLQVIDDASLDALVDRLREGPQVLLADSVDTPERRMRCAELRLDGLSGSQVGEIQRTGRIRLAVNYATAREALSQLAAGATAEALAATFRADVALCWRLLRYIASSNFGMLVPIDSLPHAIDLVGQRRLTRWLELLLGCVEHAPAPAERLNRSAMMRGRLIELLGIDYFEGDDLDNLFLVGAFSMLPAMLMQPMTVAIAPISLPDGLADALTTRTGRFGALLDLADALESGADDQVDLLSSELSLSGPCLDRARHQAASIRVEGVLV
jgi:EAL and modified HD-GYP domain-containing signal transduction protein